MKKKKAMHDRQDQKRSTWWYACEGWETVFNLTVNGTAPDNKAT